MVTSWSPSPRLPPPSAPLDPPGLHCLPLVPNIPLDSHHILFVPIVYSLSSLSCPIPHHSMLSPTEVGLPGQWCFPGSLSVPSQAVPGQGASISSPQPVGLGWLEPWGCSWPQEHHQHLWVISKLLIKHSLPAGGKGGRSQGFRLGNPVASAPASVTEPSHDPASGFNICSFTPTHHSHPLGRGIRPAHVAPKTGWVALP